MSDPACDSTTIGFNIKRPDIRKKFAKRRTPEMMLEAMSEKRKKLEDAVLRMNSDFVQAVGRNVIRSSRLNLHSIKENNPNAYYAIIEEKDTPETKRIFRDIINKITAK